MITRKGVFHGEGYPVHSDHDGDYLGIVHGTFSLYQSVLGPLTCIGVTILFLSRYIAHSKKDLWAEPLYCIFFFFFESILLLFPLPVRAGVVSGGGGLRWNSK